jgi:hypothetical protein
VLLDSSESKNLKFKGKTPTTPHLWRSFFVAKSVEGLPSAPGYGTRKMIETVIWTK